MMAEPERVISIEGDRLRDVIDGGEVEEMAGDAIVAERVARVLRRDCARRKMLARLLPALDTRAASILAADIDSWPDARMRSAAWEVLNAHRAGLTPRITSKSHERPGAAVRSPDAEGGQG